MRRSGYSAAIRSVSSPARTRGRRTARSTGEESAAGEFADAGFGTADTKYMVGGGVLVLNKPPQATSVTLTNTVSSARITSAPRFPDRSIHRSAATDSA